MYIVDGIAYAGTPENYKEEIVVTHVKPLKDHKLLLHFSTGEKKEYDVKPLLKYPIFKPLENEDIFNKVRVKTFNRPCGPLGRGRIYGAFAEHRA